MTAQTESQDISQLKALALNLGHDTYIPQQGNTASILLQNASRRSPGRSLNSLHTQNPPKTSNVTVVQHDTAYANVEPHVNGVRPQEGLRPKSLPSTIPDSARQKTMSKHSQSQGDTQPVSQWVYDKYTTGRDTQPESNDRQGTSQNEATESQGLVGQTVDSHHIDLLAAWEQQHSARDVESILPFAALNDEDDDLLSQGDIYTDIYPESKRFSVPKTPASQSRKRKRGSQTPSQEMQTPSLPVNPFAGQSATCDLMDPSQLFKATQALTSPANAAVDLLSDRPSPDLQNMQRPSTADTVSSPITLRRANMTRAVTEPHTTYLSMKESQEERERQRKLQEQRDLEDESSDGEFNTDGTAYKKYICQKRRDHAARTQFAGLTASPIKPQKRLYTKRDGKGVMSPQSSPLRSGKHLSDPCVISDDVSPELAPDDTINSTEDETEHEEDVEGRAVIEQPTNVVEENKENVEVPMTVKGLRQAPSDIVASQPTPTHNNARSNARVPRAIHSNLEPSSPTAPRSPERSTASTHPSQIYGVADSQSSQRPRTERPAIDDFHSSSLGAMVPQSQLSQVVKSSSAPMPPTQGEGSPPQGEGEGKATVDKVSQDASKAEVPNKPSDGQSEVAAEAKDATPNQSPRAQVETDGPQPTKQTQSDSVASHVPSPCPTPDPTSKAQSSHKTVTPSGPSTMYETAHETMDQTPSKSRVSTLRNDLRSKPTSPAKSQSQSQSWRGMSDIMADSSPRDDLGDAISGIHILTEDDKEYHHALNGSIRESRLEKRRKLGHQGGLRRETSGLHQDDSTDTASSTRWKPLELGLEARPEGPLPSSQPTWSMTTQPEPEPEPEPVVNDTSPPTNQKISDQATLSELLQANAKALPAVVATKHSAPSESQSPVSSGSLKRKRDSNLSVPTAPATGTLAGNYSIPAPIVPNRVFAHFNGDSSYFYPATCTGIIPGNEPRYRVHFDHGADTIVSGYVIKRLELRPGDICKVDMEGMRTKNFIVLEARHPTETADGGHQAALTEGIPVSRDVYGHKSVLVYPKNRQSDGGEQSDRSKVEIPISRIYITQTQWTAIRDRDFAFVSDKLPMLTGLQTPSERPSTPSTPTSRTRRAKASALSFSRPTKASADATGGLFTNMVFTLTNISSSTRLDQTKHLITSNGGRVLEQGFDELFVVPEVSRPTSPSKRGPKNSTCQLTPEAKTVGFTCLIADEHWRGAKYMQALALGIPCLATRWISDSLAKLTLLPLPPYLLAAGTSTFLDGATRSRTLDPMPDPNTSTLEEIVASRSTMLSDTSVLLIMQKHEEGPMRHHIFLTHALGASKVAKATTVEGAAKAVAEAGEPWDWVYTHSDRVAEVEQVLYGGVVGGRGRKRKRTSGGGRDGGMTRPRVVEHEFVIQSLILGQLAE